MNACGVCFEQGRTPGMADIRWCASCRNLPTEVPKQFLALDDSDGQPTREDNTKQKPKQKTETKTNTETETETEAETETETETKTET